MEKPASIPRRSDNRIPETGNPDVVVIVDPSFTGFGVRAANGATSRTQLKSAVGSRAYAETYPWWQCV